MVRDPETGKYRRTRLFVLTLGYSRKSVRLLVFHSSSRTWADLHEKVFVLGKLIGKSLGLEWGGDFNSIIDKPHFHCKTGKPMAELRKLKKEGN